ncbi:MAG: AAA family ATPase [Candidatus Micrarchaeota archaeon]
MASNIFRELPAESGIFRDESVLRPEFMPDELPGREREMREMALCLQEAARGRAPPSMLLTGPPGVGKTSTAKMVLKQLQEVSRKALPVYINCWESSTRFGILNALVLALGDMMPRRGIATDEIIMRLAEIGRRQEMIPIVVLDEMDRLLASGTHEEQILYDLSRAHEALGIKASMIGITNDEEVTIRLDARVRSSLTNHAILFKPYGPAELKDILKARAARAFAPHSLDDEVIGVCAAVGAKAGGDARLAIHSLWAAGKKAEQEGARRVGVSHVKAAQAYAIEQGATPAVRKSGGLDLLDKKIIEMIMGSAGMDSGAIYAKLGMDEPNEQRNIRNRLSVLEKGGLIDGEERAKPDGGHTRRWKIRRTD